MKKIIDRVTKALFYYGNCLCNPSVLIGKNVYKAFNYQDKRLLSLSDFDLWVKLSFEHKFWILDEKLTKFRIRDLNMNVSAETSGSVNRSAFEYKQTLDHYLISLTAKKNIFYNDNPINRGFIPRMYTQLKKVFNKDNPKI